MEGLRYYNKLYSSYSAESSGHFKEFWNPIMADSSPKLRSIALTPRKCMAYYTVVGYLASSVADLFDRKVSDSTLHNISDMWLGIKLIDEMIDKKIVGDVESYLDDFVKALTCKKIARSYGSIADESLSILQMIGNTQDCSGLEGVLTDLTSEVVRENNSRTFRQYLETSISVGRYSGALLHDTIIINDGKIFPDHARTLFEDYSESGNLLDDIGDFSKDQKETGMRFTFKDRMTLYTEYIKSTRRLMRHPEMNLGRYVASTLAPLYYLAPRLVLDKA